MASKEPKAKPAAAKRPASRKLTRLNFIPSVEGPLGVSRAVVENCQSCRVFMEFSNIPLEPGTHEIEVTTTPGAQTDDTERLNVRIRGVGRRNR